MERENNGDAICNSCALNNPQKLIKEAERVENFRTNGIHQDYCIV